MTQPKSGFRRGDIRDRVERDKKRLERRKPSPFWKSVALVGSVGWPIALFAIGGGVLGRYLDERWHTGVRFTLILLCVATTAGVVIAFRSLRGDDS
jgi:predicted F0F1-ATPase subunit